MAHKTDYNEMLRKISNNLENALSTFGPSSTQYQAILSILKECLQEIESGKNQDDQAQMVDPDALSVAMGFLEIGGS
ncbi:hypothetical protein N7462_005155 [Penicillium macrosclerotiorum]|uniref:uncharacterized protein n=1 Tax=Penicillium macrosclerotiorum TaxID=303699 RepID=UPI0025487B2F|nr:uncharacterized protein N7462_005155 [Penicillium macrosclerotiorum]KAJ5690763.1 hypothetical protein N7462_005155 [Penicillium macrosclerotiorum]